MTDDSMALRTKHFFLAPIHDLDLLVPECLPPDEKAQVASALSIGESFNVDALVDLPDALQYLHSAGSLLVFPFIVEATRERPRTVIPLLCVYLLRYGFARPYKYSEILPLIVRHTPDEFRRVYRHERQLLVESIPAAIRRDVGLDCRLLVRSLHATDREDARMLKKLRRWLILPPLLGHPEERFETKQCK